MKKTPRPKKPKRAPSTHALVVRLDRKSKSYLTKAAELRRLSISDYVRTVIVAQARREVEDADDRVIRLSPEGQLAFWNALNDTSPLTPAEKRLGAMMRGEL